MLDGLVGLTTTLVSNPRPIRLIFTEGTSWGIWTAACIVKSFGEAITTVTADMPARAVSRRTPTHCSQYANRNRIILCRSVYQRHCTDSHSLLLIFAS